MRHLAFGVGFCLCVLSGTAWADGKRDLDDGIAFYENLDTDRALYRLTEASKADDLGPADRAKAFLYLGMLQFEIGNKQKAKAAWTEAVRLKRDIRAPEGTSPKTIEALDAVRASVQPAEPGGAKTSPPPPSAIAPPPPTEVAPPPPEVPPPPPPSSGGALTTTPPAPAEGGSNTWLWVGIGAGAAAVVAGVVAVAVIASSGGSECEMGGGGCLVVTFE